MKMSDYLYNAYFGIFQRMNLKGGSTPSLPNIIVREAVDDPIHADKRFIINAKHDYALDSENVIEAIINASNKSLCGFQPIDSRAKWDALPRVKQIALQIGWCT